MENLDNMKGFIEQIKKTNVDREITGYLLAYIDNRKGAMLQSANVEELDNELKKSLEGRKIIINNPFAKGMQESRREFTGFSNDLINYVESLVY